MKIRATTILILLLLLFSASAAQEKPGKLVQFQMAIMKKGPAWNTTKPDERNGILKQHLASVISLLDSGKAIIAGPFGDNSDLAGIFILRATSSEEAKRWIDNDPAVKANLMLAEIHPWWSQDIYRKANTSPLNLEGLYH